VRQGKVLYIGCSNYAAYRLMSSLWTSKTQHLSSFVTLQAEYSLVARNLEREHVPLCREMGLGILPWSPLAGGFLSGKYERSAPVPAGTRLGEKKDRFARFDNERCWGVLGVVKEVAVEVSSTPSAVSLAWLLSKPQVTSAIFGARDLAQLESNVQATEVTLSPEQLQRLDDASALELGYPYGFMKDVQGRW
jgi:aryl-alcohol dehydrogenase-like predicted oxidoreductase